MHQYGQARIISMYICITCIQACIHTCVHTYLHTRIHANSFLRLTVADRSATVKGSGSMGRPLGRHRARSSIIGTDADTCRGQCILSLAALLRGPGPRGPGQNTTQPIYIHFLQHIERPNCSAVPFRIIYIDRRWFLFAFALPPPAFLVGSVRHLGRCFGCGGRTQRSVARGIDRVASEQHGNQHEGHVHRKQHFQDRHEARVGLAIG